jgi:predicted amidophosphoribosyltransferase
MGEVICEPCLTPLLKPPPPRCLECGEPVPCKLHRGGGRIYSAGLYEGGLREAVLMLKGKYRVMGARLGRACARVLVRPDADLLVPVPLHLDSPRRYNQALVIAEALGRAWDIEALPAARWTKDAPSRSGMSAAQREALTPDFFAFDSVAGARIALVDDVCTTGSTLSRLAEAARGAGADVPAAFTVAQTPY